MMLSAQLDAIARIQAAITNIEKLRTGINAAIASHDLDLRALGALPQLGMLAHSIEGLLFAHDGDIERAQVEPVQPVQPLRIAA